MDIGRAHEHELGNEHWNNGTIYRSIFDGKLHLNLINTNLDIDCSASAFRVFYSPSCRSIFFINYAERRCSLSIYYDFEFIELDTFVKVELFLFY